MTAAPGGMDARTIERPGTEGIWTFVFLDMVVFALMLFVYLNERVRAPAVFAPGQAELNPFVGLLGTVFLLTSFWCMVEAVATIRLEDRARGGDG